MRLVFDDPDFDGQLQRSVAKEPYGMANLGECLAIANHIGEDDTESWFDAFADFATDLRGAAEQAALREHGVTAREEFLRASEYYRNAFFYQRGDLDALRLHEAYEAHRACFQAAIRYLAFPVEAATVPEEDFYIAGYFAAPTDDGTPRPTLVVPSGYDSTAEELYPAMAAAVEHGYNAFVFDGPGQGSVLYKQRVTMRPDWERVLPTVIDVLSSRSDVDNARIVLLGRSFAGLLAPRAAAHEPRLAALVVDPGQYDMGAAMLERLPAQIADRLDEDSPEVEAYANVMLDHPRWRRFFLPRMAAHGSTNVLDYLRTLRDYHAKGHAELIRCPTLVCDNEEDAVSTLQGATLYDHLSSPKSYIRFASAEGAAGHCEGLNQPIFYARMFDWLDETLKRH
ncbi:hypothetical protein CAI21_16425 [Alkalilimnicola ehrlichii]|uniref:alpha/beta hydrolase family protein n=1 Tax=Alkalilimnicola ehrlichii TaxID=351052 RepID=UPI000E2F8902|nr:alpha/beta fold hydrolase [Alkalilimnicola ehrlichii]RFA26556.1 hypothetical protein CAI21_16425 [Alkalilimnicola ehrlichii]